MQGCFMALKKMMKYFGVILLLSLSKPVLADTSETISCIPGSSGFIGSKSVDLSPLFIGRSQVTATFNTNWSATVSCTGEVKNRTLLFFSAFEEPVYIKFTDSTSADTFWVKVTAVPLTSKTSVSTSGASFSMADYQTAMALTAELTTDPGDGVDMIAADNNTANIYLGATTPLTSMTAGEVREFALTNPAALSRFLFGGVQKVALSYTPSTMTCNVPNQNITLPTIGLNALKTGSSSGKSNIEIPFNCSSESGNAEYNIHAWLASNDIVDSANKVIRNEESTSKGIGISLQTQAGEDVEFSTSTDVENATDIFSVSKGENLSTRNHVSLAAYYSVYDNSQVSPGTVTATASVVLSYD